MRIKRLLGYREEIVSSNMAWVIVLAVVIAGSGSIIGRFAYAESRPATAVAAQTPAQTVDAREQAEKIEQTTAEAAETEAKAADAERQVREAAEQSKAIHKELEAAQRNLAESAEDVSNLTVEQQAQLDEAQKKVQDAMTKLNSDQLKKELEQVRQQLNSPEFKKQLQEAVDAAKKINSAEMQKQIADATEQIARSREVREKIQKELNSPEFKKEMEAAKEAARKINTPEMRKQIEEATKLAQEQIKKELHSPEFKKQIEAAKKQGEQFNTPEFKEKIKRMLDEAKAKQIEAEEQRQKIASNSAEAANGAQPTPPSEPGVAPSAPDNPVHVSSGVVQALKQVQPVYPPEAKAAGIQGTVILKAVISREGNVEKLSVVSGPKELMQSAIDAVSQWKYKPYLLNGQPVDVETTISVNYSLAEAAPNPTPSSTPQANALPGGADKSMPALIFKVDPKYTGKAKTAKIQGPVMLTLTVNQQGLPVNVHVVQSLDPGLDKNAVKAVKQYRFQPAVKDGKPVVKEIHVEVHFQIL